jgi:hypothetical protein
MDVVSFCPLRVGSLRWQPRPGAHALTVICKATFELRAEESPLAAQQDPPWEADISREGGAGSLRAASDLVPFKRAADVLVVGRAHAPRGQAVASLVARMSVGTLSKALEVRAEQGWFVAGLGPLAPTSPSRVAMLGKYAAAWEHQSWNTRPLPDDVNGAFFNAAPVDQQLAELRGDELIALEHLHPVHARLVTRLARVVPRATARRDNDQVQEVRLRCDTLTIDADRGRATLVWRGVVLIAHEAEQGLVAVTAEVAETVAVDDVEATMTIVAPMGKTAAQAPVLPFASGTVSVLSNVKEGEKRAQDVAPRAPADDVTRTIVGGLGLIADTVTKQVLPFVPGAAPREIASGSAACSDEEQERDATGTMFLRVAPIKPALPFERSQQKQQIEPPVVTAIPVRPELARALQPAKEEPLAPHEDRAPEEEARRVRADPFDVAPPPMLGPLAGVQKPAEEKQVADASIVQKAALAQPEGDVIAPAPVVLPEPEPEPVELTIGQVATIAAELAEGKVERKKVLDAHGLRERGWRENERRWTSALEEESARGIHGLRGKYDAAYVARVEGFRGPIKLEEYARIVTGLERGQANGVLDSLRIQQPALMPIVRLWTRKVAQDMKLGDAATLAIRAARRA